MNDVLQKVKGGLIVSCQALPEEPLHSSFIMGRMAFAAKEGGAVGIRANSVEDILEIRNNVDLPVIGIIKAVYENSEVYITPTEKEVEELIEKAHPEIIALDATDRFRPDGSTISTLFPKIREKYPDQLFMADCASYEDGMRAQKLGFDLVGTTLCGYTADTKGTKIPSFDLIHHLTSDLSVPLIAEGGIWEREDLQEGFKNGAFAAVIGTAVTRPREITRRFVEAIS